MKKEIPFKNYAFLISIIVVTVLMTFYMRNWYIMGKQYSVSGSPLLNVVNEINPDEISNYIYENPKFVLYTSSDGNNSIIRFEKNFQNYIRNKGLENSIIYINVDKVSKSDLSDELKKYADNRVLNRIDVNNNASMYFFDNGIITKVFNNAQNLSIKQVDMIFKKNKVLDNA